MTCLPLAVALLLAACGGTAASSASVASSPAGGVPASVVAAATPPAAPARSAPAAAIPAGPLQPSSGPPVLTPVPPASTAPRPSLAPVAPSAEPPRPSAPAGTQGSGTTALQPAVTITEADDGKTFQVKIGQVVDVALKAEAGMDDWQVANPNAAILAPTVNPAATAARGVTLRAFKAAGAGTATIEATDRPTCGPGQACPHFVRAFRATVVVAA